MIRVMIERKIREGHEQDFWELIGKLRSNAVLLPGYISGETWVDNDDPLHLVVLSTWDRMEEWLTWKQSTDRKNLLAALEPLLAEPACETILRRLPL